MASSTQYGGATAAPPPTPSSQPNNHISSPDNVGDLLSRLLHRLPPTLSLPTRRTPSAPPTISFRNPLPDALLSQSGYFQLVDHPIPSQLARSAESDSISLFNLAREKKRVIFSSNWPIGFHRDEDEYGDENSSSEVSESFCVDASSTEAATELDLSSLTELTREMEKIGLKMIELMSTAADFENPTGDDSSKICSHMRISIEGNSGQDQVNMGRVYPYIVGLTYQLRPQLNYSLLSDSGWVTVSPQVDSVLVTVGDIAQVWSNGVFKKVQGIPVPNMGAKANCSSSNENSPSCITMTLLVTLGADSIVRPLLLPNAKPIEESKQGEEPEASTSNNQTCPDNDLKFKSFPFEDYAWRVYNERIILQDPLDRYRI
ncbi:unnamed protein product [Rhodiola kirilowii]